YREMLAFLQRVGVPVEQLGLQERLEVTMVEAGGQRLGLKAGELSPPLDLAAGLASFKGASLIARARALAFGLALRTGWRAPKDSETCERWLARNRQARGINRALWHPLIWATLNEAPRYASAEALHAVLQRAMFE